MLAQLLAFVSEHQAVFAGISVAVLDALFAFNPKANANGVLHWFYDKLVGIKKP